MASRDRRTPCGGGQRWFLQLREIVGDSYPSGLPRRELFAVREDDGEAFTVQLTDQPDLEPLPEGSASLFWGFVRWGIGDAEISWIARRWKQTWRSSRRRSNRKRNQRRYRIDNKKGPEGGRRQTKH